MDCARDFSNAGVAEAVAGEGSHRGVRQQSQKQDAMNIEIEMDILNDLERVRYEHRIDRN